MNLNKEFFNIISVGRYAPQKIIKILNALRYFRRNYLHLNEIGINLILIGKSTNNLLLDNPWFDPKDLNLK